MTSCKKIPMMMIICLGEIDIGCNITIVNLTIIYGHRLDNYEKNLYMKFQAKLPHSFHRHTYMDMKEQINMCNFKIWLILNKPNYEKKFNSNQFQIGFNSIQSEIDFNSIQFRLNSTKLKSVYIHT